MPAIRNRFNAKKMSENGEQDSSNALVLKKKLIQLEEEQEELEDHQELNNNNNNNTRPASEEDTFDDLQTTRAHAKLRLKQDTASNNQEGPEIFSQRSQSAQDQFAVALLRLQLDLDETSARLGQLETKLEHVSKQYQQQQQQANKAKASAKGGPFGSSNLANLIYFAWPVVVFVAVRAIERRASSISSVKIVA